MAIARVQYGQSINGVVAQNTLTLTGTASGNALVILVVWDGTPTFTSVTISGETVVNVGSVQDFSAFSTTNHSRWCVVNSLASGGSKSVVADLSAAPAFGLTIMAWEVSGAESAGIYDNSGSANGTSSVPSVSVSASVSPTAIFAWACGNSGKPTAGSSPIAFTAEGAANSIYYSDTERAIGVTGTGSKTINFTGSQSEWGIHGIIVKESGATGGSSGVPKTTKLAMLGVG